MWAIIDGYFVFQSAYGGYVYTYAVKSIVDLNKTEGAYLNAVFWVSIPALLNLGHHETFLFVGLHFIFKNSRKSAEMRRIITIKMEMGLKCITIDDKMNNFVNISNLNIFLPFHGV